MAVRVILSAWQPIKNQAKIRRRWRWGENCFTQSRRAACVTARREKKLITACACCGCGETDDAPGRPKKKQGGFRSQIGGTGLWPVVSGVPPETVVKRAPAFNFADNQQRTASDEIRRDAGFDGRDDRATKD